MKQPGSDAWNLRGKNKEPMDTGPGKITGFCLAVLLLCLPFSDASAAEAVNPLHGTAHMFEYGSVEPVSSECGSLCHSFLGKEKAFEEGQRAWADGSAVEESPGIITALCATCHRSGGAHGATMSSAISDNNVYHPNSHGQKMALANPPASTDTGGSGLSNVDASEGTFQCNTCHEPHTDTFRPFLADDMVSICAACHRKRSFVNGVEQSGSSAATGTWDLNSFTGTSNPGSHPVGEDVVGERANGSPVEINCFFRIEFAPEPGFWSLGPHLSNGFYGGVTCLTCHAVHGVDLDTDAYGDMAISTSPDPCFLAVPQSEGTVSGYERPMANGSGRSNFLCEACHGLDGNPAATPAGEPWSDDKHHVNPGKQGRFSHPVDSYPSTRDMGVSVFPEGWPEGDPLMAGEGVAPTPICETCHAPHPAAALGINRRDVSAGAGEFMLRAPVSGNRGETLLCEQCHDLDIPGHHPVFRTYDSSGVPYLRGARAASTDRLTCSTCHSNAHEWSSPGLVGLDANWLPADNGRSPVQVEDMYNPDMSKTCMDCHYSMDGDGASMSPTMGLRQTVIDSSDDEHKFYEVADKSMGTHYIGLIHENNTKWRYEPVLDLFSTTKSWKEQGAGYEDGLSTGWSRFGGTDSSGSRVLVCESCHELQWSRNGGFRHLLLAPYEEGKNGLDEYRGDGDGHDILCEACHGIPQGSHPMTGSEVTKTKELMNPEADWVRQEQLGYATVGKTEAALSCDSCHQPHDANSNSATFILDVPEAISSSSNNFTIEKGDIMPGYSELVGSSAEYREFDGSPGTYTSPRSGPITYHALCLSCHDK